MAHYDLKSPRPQKDGKTSWFKVGAAFPRDSGGFQLVFDALPLPDAEGRVTLMMWEAQPRDGQRPQSGAPAGGAARVQRDMPDDGGIPFAPCVLL